MIKSALYVAALIAAFTMSAAPVSAQNPTATDNSNIQSSTAPASPENDVLSKILPSTIGIGDQPAAVPAPQPQEDFPLGYRHWTEMSSEGKDVLASAMIDGVRLSSDFSQCSAIDGPSLVAGIDEWMTNGDRSAALMTITAYIAYSLCTVTVPAQNPTSALIKP